MKYKLILLQVVLVFAITLHANNLTISNTNYDGNETITFDLTWENSWRTSITQPYNYDGVWIFVKVRECTQKNLGSPSGFTHAWLSTTVTEHSATNSAPGGEALTIEMGNTDISGDKGMGIFIYQTGDVTEATDISTTVTLRWDKTTQGAAMAEIDAADNYDVQVFGVEMVYIPQGDFYVGDGASSNCFQDAAGNPYQITSEASFNVSGTNNRDIDPGGANTVNANFPKGWDSFWIMKYEITQYQYAEFLNTLTPTQAQERTTDDLFTMTARNYVMSNNANIQARQAIILDPQGDTRTDRFYVNLDNDNNYNESEDGLGLACNYLSLRDVFAYLDWAALRPLTEFEYEKSCRGSIYPQLNEYAWGSVGITPIQGIVNSGQTNERAIASGVGLCNYNGGGSSGPMRVGFTATSTTNRAEAGCSYYGVMDLTGNIAEPYISFYNNMAITDLFVGDSGDGELANNGNHNTTTWAPSVGTQDYNIAITKGGSWAHGSTTIYVSYRGDISYYDNATYISSRNQFVGGRGGR